MAKLSGPLMSMDARGQVGKTLVFSGWKGVKVARQFVVPAYTNTTAQSTQRTHMRNAVSAYHAMAASALAAWTVCATLAKTAMSGFNHACLSAIACGRSAADKIYTSAISATFSTNKYVFSVTLLTLGGTTPATGETNVIMHYGYTPTNLSLQTTLTHTSAGVYTGDSATTTAVGVYGYVTVGSSNLRASGTVHTPAP
jgi:hypothetical protein